MMLKPTKTDSPRPGQNAHGVRRKGPAQGLPQLQPSQPAQPQQQGFAGVSDMPGLPPEVQGFPQDMQSLQAQMMQGFRPGASTVEHQQGMAAAAMARAQEGLAVQEAMEQEDEQMKLQQIGLIAQQMMRGQGPPGPLRQQMPQLQPGSASY